MIYTVTFNPAIDYIVHTGTMQVGQVNRSQGEELYFGGKGINVSFVVSLSIAVTSFLQSILYAKCAYMSIGNKQKTQIVRFI